ncbi:MAG: WG repeat-containing protein [Chitinophaga sp.]|uniref:WG repeat-containing protein n=1 Tax=Chitinophaga sp. TaxID=1869181 RepID=UPI0025BAEA34|nr:WG repeat-containing protein [Chitinophaga sp.]MBV8253519.1 WG repeat-containing protein [Chitinophaga sp.]
MTKHIRFLPVLWLVVCSMTARAQKASVFVNGLARMQNGAQTWYINTAGQKVFDRVIGTYHPMDSLTGTPVEDDQALMLLVKSQGKFGVWNAQRKWILQPVYDSIELQWKSYLALKQHKKRTYADTYGHLLLPLQFEEVGILDDDHFDVKANGKWGIYSNKAQKLVVPAVYDGFDYCGGCGTQSNYVFAKKNGKWGILNFNNETLLPFEYGHEHFGMRSDNWIKSLFKNDEQLIINLQQKKVYSSPEYTDMEVLDNGLLRAKHNGYYGLIGEDGQQVSDFVYDNIEYPYEEGSYGPYVAVTKNKKTGILDDKGREILAPAYSGKIACFANCFIVPVNGNYRLVDSTGKNLLDKDYNSIYGFVAGPHSSTKNPIFILKQQAVYGFYNPVSKKTVAPAFFDISADDNGELLLVEYQQKKGLYNTDGTELIPMGYKGYGQLAGSVYVINQNNRKGLYDIKQRKQILPMEYEEIRQLEGDSNLVLLIGKKAETDDDKYGLCNIQGDLLLAPAYHDIVSIGNGMCLLKTGLEDSAHYSLFNTVSKQLTALPYSVVSPGHIPDQIMVGKEDKVGLINMHGDVIIPFEYRYIRSLLSGVYIVIKQTNDRYQYGYADSAGKLIVPVIYDYDEITFREFGTKGLILQKADPTTGYIRLGLASMNGLIMVPANNDLMMEGTPGPGFVAKQNNKFMVLDNAGRPVSPVKYEDVLLQEVPGYGATSLKYSYPVLCKVGNNNYQYLTLDGKILPVKVTGVISFLPEYEEAFPTL